MTTTIQDQGQQEQERVRAAAAALREGTVVLMIKATRFYTRRSVSQAEAVVKSRTEPLNEPDQDLLAVGKDLLDSEELRAIQAHDIKTQKEIKRWAVPSPIIRHSAFLLSVDALVEMYEWLETRAAEREQLVAAFKAAYPGLKDKAQTRLGPLFDETEYPPVEVLERKFSLTWNVVEVGTPDAKLRTISKALYEKEKEKAESTWLSAVGQIEEALAVSIREEVFDYLAEKICEGKPKGLTDKGLQRVKDFLDAFQKRNLTGSKALTDLVEKARQVLGEVSAADLKKDPLVRASTAARLADVRKDLDSMIVEKPSRVFALDEDAA